MLAKRYIPKHQIRKRPGKGFLNNNFFIIFLKCALWVALGTGLGFLFFYFFKNQAVYFINKFKVIQSIFGIREYQVGMTFRYVLITIIAGNLISTIGYFILGYLRFSIPASIITGFFVLVLLMAGTIRHSAALPPEVIFLASIETFYRVLTLSTGEYLMKNKFRRKLVPIIILILIAALLVFAVFYEMNQIFK
ncbi:MAG: hypothetical protein M1409_05510 [Actinobacteria bacterium]|nr:hypothetical protein [Actinomycetota bacterium]